VPAASAPPHPASSVGGSGQQAGSDKRGARGKGGGKQPPTQAQIAANDAKARLQAEEAELKLLQLAAKKAEAQARFDKAKSDASSVTAASTPRAKPGATSGGGDFVTHDEFNKFRGQVQDGFSTVIQQNQRTHDVLAGFLQMINGGGLPAPKAPDSRQIGNSPQEVVEQRKISCWQNAGWDHAAERPRIAQPPTPRASSAIACGGGAQTFHREPVGSSTPIHRGSMPKFEAAAARWNKKNSANNAQILDTIRKIANGDDDMACLLLALVNGKTYSEIVKMYGDDVASLLTTGNTPFFQRFFTALSSCGLPANFDVKVDSSKTKSGDGFVMTYQQLSQAPGNVDKLVRILRGE
jgi:hypothetical protein